MFVLGHILAVAVGAVLGIVGGGGSILALPILVYVCGVAPVLATAYSLFIVGSASLLGSLTYLRQKMFSFEAVLFFGLPSVLSVFLTRRVLLPVLPDEIVRMGERVLTKDRLLMIVFAVLMASMAISMLRQSGKEAPDLSVKVKNRSPLLFTLEGLFAGLLTGLVGVGGGFMIVPMLVTLAGLPIKIAIGTSLCIIALKSLIGFLGDLAIQEIDWQFLLIFTGFTMLGMLVSTRLIHHVRARWLQDGFAYLLIIASLAIFLMESRI